MAARASVVFDRERGAGVQLKVIGRVLPGAQLERLSGRKAVMKPSRPNTSWLDRCAAATHKAEVVEPFRAKLEGCQQRLERLTASAATRDLTTLELFNELSIELWNLTSVVAFLQNVHPSLEVREGCELAEQEAHRFINEMTLNRDLYDAFDAIDDTELEQDARRLRDRLLRDFRRAGVDRDDETRATVRRLREELVSLGQEFVRTIAADTQYIQLADESELAGLPADYVRERRADPSGIRITTDYPDYNPFMSYAESGERRRELYVAFRRRGYPENLDVLDKILAKRHQLALTLGYQNWADYATEDKMIGSAAGIDAFINRIADTAQDAAKAEYEILLESKRAVEPDATVVYDWERLYYEKRVEAQRFQVESKEVRQYFESGRVKDGLLRITEEFFGVRFVAAPDAVSWHEATEVLDVLEGDQVIGRVYLDLYPRDGKFKHAAMFGLQSGVRDVQLPMAALVCNFPDPSTSEEPVVMEHADVVTFFHEFGHLLHHLCARNQRWIEFSGTATEWDFVEVPSQVYEEWAWDVDVLKQFAVHTRTGEVIPSALVAKLCRARDFGRALRTRHQMFYAAVSYACHTTAPQDGDTTRLMRELQNRYSYFPYVDGTYFQASFGHLEDYSALYYTYMWSLVIAKDLLCALKKNGTFDVELARRFRDAILAPGGSKDASDLVHDFLGRNYSEDAFATWLAGE